MNHDELSLVIPLRDLPTAVDRYGIQSRRRLTRGVYAAVDDVDLRTLMAALRLAVGEEPVWTGLSAAYLLDAPVWSQGQTLEMACATSGRHRHRDGARMRRMTLRECDVRPTPLGRSLSALRTATDLATRSTSALTIAQVDQVLRADRLSTHEFEQYLCGFPGLRGIRRARDLAQFVDPRAESVRETLLRVALMRRGFPQPTPQLKVYDGSRFVGRLDLGWEEHRLGLEYDGKHHLQAEFHAKDLRRHNDFRALGWTVFQVEKYAFRNIDRLAAQLEPLLLQRD